MRRIWLETYQASIKKDTHSGVLMGRMMELAYDPYGSQSAFHGFSHGLKTVHWTVFTPAYAGVGLSNPIQPIKNNEAYASVFFMGWIMGFEPTTFRATI